MTTVTWIIIIAVIILLLVAAAAFMARKRKTEQNRVHAEQLRHKATSHEATITQPRALNVRERTLGPTGC